MSNWDIIWSVRDIFWQGFLNTLAIFALSTVLAALIGMATGLALELGARPINRLLRLFIDGLRMLPFLMLAYLLYYGLPSAGIRLNAWWAGVGALAVYHGAYVAEILRGARANLAPGQIEAATALGLSPYRTYLRLILPQLLIRSRPLMGNQLIIALKDTAFLIIITVQELTAAANTVQATYFIPMDAFVVVIALYWLISIGLEITIRGLGIFGRKRGFDNG
ncbi:amino acid ABC transporter permease [Kushneria phosphatilytica]|uniref:Amino acid ABC transporter permease n=1 Tax=Kushneria phosphatilytica TaxID=657387 RepID=A0A1S1NRW9_9GAMM|nr:amino acid ABC transporter permease [Kushneria phosphatilytica]OHV07832.1 ABC transporter permease [Kushneria phosphatilytica]QEL10087.1 amino acid ABC transporter permease [Kushneria phosphatilytica]